MDPVCCLTCYPQLLDSFVYKSTTLDEAFGSIDGLANAVRIVFSRDLIIAEVCCLRMHQSCLSSSNCDSGPALSECRNYCGLFSPFAPQIAAKRNSTCMFTAYK